MKKVRKFTDYKIFFYHPETHSWDDTYATVVAKNKADAVATYEKGENRHSGYRLAFKAEVYEKSIKIEIIESDDDIKFLDLRYGSPLDEDQYCEDLLYPYF